MIQSNTHKIAEKICKILIESKVALVSGNYGELNKNSQKLEKWIESFLERNETWNISDLTKVRQITSELMQITSAAIRGSQEGQIEKLRIKNDSPRLNTYTEDGILNPTMSKNC